MRLCSLSAPLRQRFGLGFVPRRMILRDARAGEGPSNGLRGLRVLVTGGAGYVGAHVALAALDAGLEVAVLDDLSTGVRAAVPAAAAFYQGSAGDRSLVREILRARRIQAVLHFAARTVVPESVADPLGYYLANTADACALFQACAESGVRKVVMSSTAAVYGFGKTVRVDETSPVAPASPYARSKLMVEQMLQDAAAAAALDAAILRYFNVAGADPQGRAGQSTAAATHLVKAACQAALGVRPKLEVFGTDWPTRDGTGLRDFVHVSDLARAHLAALAWVMQASEARVFNLGSGVGYTVREVAAAVAAAAGRPLRQVERGRRPGDVAALVADCARARTDLGWAPEYGLADMAASALAWERGLQGGARRSARA